ncbi:hypothetical protein [Acidithiobacillus ferriphilus]|uniref:hypothetical protein n=1 Tax=Acidithiobacillus ferriphilus TaxID=1689834 RepID=UPI002DBD5D6B|nr:hypothetical protein [Acidithiobacillus ferriphilus]MEB8476800.1 hypothetical protein [Acidithiobacillus ferriphilus]
MLEKNKNLMDALEEAVAHLGKQESNESQSLAKKLAAFRRGPLPFDGVEVDLTHHYPQFVNGNLD